MSFTTTLFSRISSIRVLTYALIGLLSISGAPIRTSQQSKVPAQIEVRAPKFRRGRALVLQIWKESKLVIDFSGQLAFKKTEFIAIQRLFRSLQFNQINPTYFLIIPSLGRASVHTA